ncbi:MAG: sigma 54-interacting transcriptional regulator, partial [bacterium]
MNILIVDENEVFRRQLFWAIRKGNDLHEASGRAEARTLLANLSPDLVLMELLEEGDRDETGGLEFVASLRADPAPPLILIITRSDRKEIAARALRLGAFDFLPKPVDLGELPVILKRAERLKALDSLPSGRPAREEDAPLAAAAPAAQGEPEVIGVETRVKQILEQLRRIAPTPVSVLITGETGTGKEIFAKTVHRMSDRANHRFIALNCAVLSDTLVEDELFGHEKGAFTGAV